MLTVQLPCVPIFQNRVAAHLPPPKRHKVDQREKLSVRWAGGVFLIFTLIYAQPATGSHLGDVLLRYKTLRDQQDGRGGSGGAGADRAQSEPTIDLSYRPAPTELAPAERALSRSPQAHLTVALWPFTQTHFT